MLPFNVCIIRFPKPGPGFQAYYEVAETVTFALRRLGYEANLTDNQVFGNQINIIFGFQVLGVNMQIPPGTIFYNLEQIATDRTDFKPFFQLIKSNYVMWDYCDRNCELFLKAGFSKLVHVPIGYVPELTRIPRAEPQDIDVLFYGEITPSRKQVLEQLAEHGLKVEALTNIYGVERDQYIARSKVVLNMHKLATRIFEVVRVSYLLANKKAVVSELDPHTLIEPDFVGALLLVSRAQLVSACRQLVQNHDLRSQWEQHGFATISARDECAYLKAALAASFPGSEFAT